jgi:hypothetical protein
MSLGRFKSIQRAFSNLAFKERIGVSSKKCAKKGTKIVHVADAKPQHFLFYNGPIFLIHQFVETTYLFHCHLSPILATLWRAKFLFGICNQIVVLEK